MLDKCPDCGSHVYENLPNSEMFSHFECSSMFENTDPPRRCGSQPSFCVLAAKDARIAALTEELERVKKLALEGIVWEKAIDDTGLYPAAVQGKYEQRTDYMNGWNDYTKEFMENAGKFEKWIRDNPSSHDLLLGESLELRANKESVVAYVNCSDLFYWACADLEEITPEEFPDLRVAIDEAGAAYGPSLWCCRKRQMRPQKPIYKNMSESQRALFDACGPERKE